MTNPPHHGSPDNLPFSGLLFHSFPQSQKPPTEQGNTAVKGKICSFQLAPVVVRVVYTNP
uniref:Uncharacterized protein n=1 Tax=Anguilla anguilla TaxID=7936 RepID=A0A0E9SSW6_ANGAN